jgi:hypothetical protein
VLTAGRHANDEAATGHPCTHHRFCLNTKQIAVIAKEFLGEGDNSVEVENMAKGKGILILV